MQRPDDKEKVSTLLKQAVALFDQGALKQAREEREDQNRELEERFHELLKKGGR